MTGTKNPVTGLQPLPGIKKTTEPNCTLKQGNPEYQLYLNWLHEFEMLCARYSGLGITPDIADLSLVEAWGLYCWLKGLRGAV